MVNRKQTHTSQTFNYSHEIINSINYFNKYIVVDNGALLRI